MGKPALLVLTSTFPRRAGDTLPAFVHDLCRQLATSFDVHVIAPHAPGAATHERLDGIEVHRFRYFPESRQTLAYGGGIPVRLRCSPLALLQVPFFCAAQFWSALRIAWRIRPAAVHAHWIIPQGLIGWLVSLLTPGRPALVCTVHGADLYTLNFNPVSRFKSLVLRRATHVTIVSESMRSAVLALGAEPRRLSVAPMGVDTGSTFRADPDIPRSRHIIVFAGRLVPKKGARHLVEAFALLATRAPALQLVLIGDGPERESLQRRVRELGLEARVTFCGALVQSALADHLRRAALAVFPFVPSADGDREGFGLVVVEAQSCACPVVAFDVPALRDTIRDGETGLLVANSDDAALAAAIDRLLADPELAARLGAAGPHAAARFSWTEVGRRYRELLLEISG